MGSEWEVKGTIHLSIHNSQFTIHHSPITIHHSPFRFKVHHEVEGLADAAIGFGDFAAAVDTNQKSRDAIVVEHRGRLLVVELYAVTYHILRVVRTAADGGTLVYAANQLFARHIDSYYAVNLAFKSAEKELQGLSLRHRAGEAVDDATLRTVGLAVTFHIPGIEGGIGVGQRGAELEST